MNRKAPIKGDTQLFIELYQGYFSRQIRFKIQQMGKRESDHQYMASVHIPHGKGHTYSGKGRSKKKARSNAAKSALNFQKRWLPK